MTNEPIAWFMRENRWIAAFAACALALCQLWFLDAEGGLMTSLISTTREYDTFWDFGLIAVAAVLVAAYLAQAPCSMSYVLFTAVIVMCAFIAGGFSGRTEHVRPYVTAVMAWGTSSAIIVAVVAAGFRDRQFGKAAVGRLLTVAVLIALQFLGMRLQRDVIGEVARADGGARTRPFDAMRIVVYAGFAVMVFGSRIVLDWLRPSAAQESSAA